MTTHVDTGTPAWARRVLTCRADELESLWFPRTDLVGGWVTKRARRLHEEKEDRAEAAHLAQIAELRDLCALTDDDLAWLLAGGWDPRHAAPLVTT